MRRRETTCKPSFGTKSWFSFPICDTSCSMVVMFTFGDRPNELVPQESFKGLAHVPPKHTALRHLFEQVLDKFVDD